jgi:GNAT superfamily N-acetyltransferase
MLDDALKRVENQQAEAGVRLRSPRAGDMGWIVHRHGVLYGQELGWNPLIEAYTADIVAGYLRRNDTEWERCWLAEYEGRVLGSVMLVRLADDTAQLRLLYVEPDARGLGLGRWLVQECIRTAQQLGYQRMLLLTNSELLPARALYQSLGFECTAQEPSDEFGKPSASETWVLSLAAPPAPG